MHNTHMCSFRGSSLFIPVNTTNFIPNHQSYGIKSYHIAPQSPSPSTNDPLLCRAACSGLITSILPLHMTVQSSCRTPWPFSSKRDTRTAQALFPRKMTYRTSRQVPQI